MKTSKRIVAAVLLAFTCIADATAEVIEVSAEFRASTLTPKNVFVDTTAGHTCALSGLCSGTKPVLQTRIGFEVTDTLPANARVAISLPVDRRTVQLVHESGRYTAQAQFRVTGVGGVVFSDKFVTSTLSGQRFNIQPNTLGYWKDGNTFSKAASPCSGPEGIANQTRTAFLWIYGTQSSCEKVTRSSIQAFQVADVALQYDLEMPTPFTMRPGVYRGVLRYSVGAGAGNADIKFTAGLNSARTTDTTVVINFTLTVDTIFKVEVAPGGNKIELAPQEGWQKWLFQRRASTRLVKQQAFNLWSNANFNVRLECAVRIADDCALQTVDGTAHAVPVHVSMTLPDSYRDIANRKVSNRPLKVGDDTSSPIMPVTYVGQTPGNLLFEVKETSVVEMLKHPGARYSGTLTVVWDSAI